MGWAFLWMMVVLKLPIAALLYLVWWALRQEPLPEEEPADETGGQGGSPHPRSPRPRPPRRGQHGTPSPRAPRRIRVSASRVSRTLER
jgi:hypothetical protein